MKWHHWFIIVLTQIALVALGLWVYHLLLGGTGLEPGVAITIWAAVITIVFVVFSLLALKNIDGKVSELEKLKDKQAEKFNEIESSSKAIIDSARDAKKQIVDQAELEIKKLLEKSTHRQNYFDQITGFNNELLPDKRVEAFTNFLRENKEIDGIDFAYIYIGRGNAYMSLGKFEDAKNDYEMALEIGQPLNKVNALSALANYYVQTQDYAKSIEYLKQALEANPQSANLCMDIGSSYNALKQYEEAEKYYNRALTYNPDLAEIYYNKAIREIDLSQPANREQTNAYLDKCLEINPMFLLARITKASMLIDEQKCPEAIEELNPLICKAIHPEIIKAVALRGQAYLKMHHDPMALIDLMLVQVLQPENIQNMANLAAALFRMNYLKEAHYYASRGLLLGNIANNHSSDELLNSVLNSIKIVPQEQNSRTKTQETEK